MRAKFIAAIDQGTTGTRCILFDRRGHIAGSAYEEHTQIYPRPGWVEHDAAEIWYKTKQVFAASLDIGRLDASDIAAIGITNQRETVVVWDPTTGEPLYNAIVWQDTRTKEICERLSSEGWGERIRRKTGLPIATYFSATKLKWLLDNLPGLRSRIETGHGLFGTIDAWLIWKLTGEHATDQTNASRTMLWNIESCDWEPELLDLFGIPKSALPRVHRSSDPAGYGYTGPNWPFAGPIPVCGVMGDQQAALFGQACFRGGEAKNTYGTGNFLLLNTGSQPVFSRHGSITTVAYAPTSDPTQYAIEGSIAVTGAAIQWLRDNLGIIKSAEESEVVADSVENSGGVFFVPAFSGLYAPHWDMTARGLLIGLTRYTTKAHIVRAALEATCFQTRQVLESIQDDTGITLRDLRVDGGATRNNLLMQIQADVLGIPIVRPAISETTALGAAYAAGLAIGYWKDLDEVRANRRVDRVFEPALNSARCEKDYNKWLEAVDRAKGWLHQEEAQT